MHKDIPEVLAQAGTIGIFRHQRPDMDAIGSQLGLKAVLQALYPDKTVLALGDETAFGQTMDPVPDFLDLAVILDTANAERIDGSLWKEAGKVIRLDHHIRTETLGDLDLVEEKASATCEILALLLQEAGVDIPQEAAQWLYQGLTADNLRFTTSSTRKESFQAAAWLQEQGADLARADLANFGTGIQDFWYENKVRGGSHYQGKFLYSVMEPKDWLSCGLSAAQAKEKVFALSGIEEAEVWALFTRMEDGIHYNASLRSRRIPIRWIAQKFGGGGHENAAGIKNLSPADVAEIIALCTDCSLEKAA